jgi:hypothetical protein
MFESLRVCRFVGLIFLVVKYQILAPKVRNMLGGFVGFVGI